MESNSMSTARGGFEAVVVSVLGDFKNTPFPSLSNLQMTILSNFEELSSVSNV
eukprot:CAMPEP_0201475436 /NCGR_PEP_ID=MMETSP0151_2-20130828/867_1 /ASSEMBLY_ACC=CAM_ASM_000257 /TAXON_ID=200890 /ORGANISM="Paramoeba atlantica, Strain 621/1 / CCAP 1560/9" /LENGTH=52 /DNA_ID=CAMNT_0047855529 /DNA_START=133 /DNA_END=288 /DNA_ORIENTATION=+